MSSFRPQLWTIPEVADTDKQRLPERTTLLEQRLRIIAERFPQAVFASSLAVEDMVITDMICRLQLPIRIITLHTGKLNAETEALIAATNTRYPIKLEVFHPIADDAAEFEQQFGATAMYDRVELRRRCCHIRKIEPLNRALATAPAWLTGQRRSQSDTRSELAFEEHDHARDIAKFNPIFDWEETDVWAYAQANDVPLNDLYRQGYPSIGCEPCTRPVKQGENIRSGRWWWESKDSKECGLHK
ncbi:phosphoadenylyl-sulfate reductase [Neisseria animalis]|uniref:Adenosine 5'-phosphosulfate reductase n=1 Tax=Neisseria animalis TaxID=492 RepID=A0A5P3MNW3_NEIAN|nr:phosphoadenylyl-sulfate reductase [Neisseria animalis]QEY23227.1 phosphoadenylyl-sulfate reductase [Neisseria animalis]ROW31801.1 phosphoadenylyl-sulfate reductase [Neisseria animalis]VEE08435.1 phosphoadenosine phosphosulfate reductase [Neisseria animalis]